MAEFTDEILIQVWQKVKNGTKIEAIKTFLSCSHQEAIDAYAAAGKLFGRKKVYQRDQKNVVRFDRPKKPIERPKAVYSNGGYLNLLEKYK